MHNIPAPPATRILTRRSFFAGAAAGASVLLLPGSSVIATPLTPRVVSPIPATNLLPPPMYFVPLNGTRGDFLRRLLRTLAGAIDYGQVADSVTRWVPWLRQHERAKVNTDHRDLVIRGYQHPSTASDTFIFGEQRNSRKCVFYPVNHLSAHATAADGIAPFYDMCSCTCVAQLATPSVLGLDAAAKDLLSAGNSHQVVANCLVPDSKHGPQKSRSDGVWSADYKEPDVYTAEDGTQVKVDYKRRSESVGDIRVTMVQDHLNNNVLLDRTYSVNMGD